MKPRIITKAELDRLIDTLAAQTRVYAPVMVEGKGWTEFRRIGSAREASFATINTKQPVKGLLFPQCEVMLRFQSLDPGKTTEPEPPEEQLIFGVRPCDAAGSAFLERFFAGPESKSADQAQSKSADQAQSKSADQAQRSDPYFRARRERTTLVGLACNQPADTCFCLAVGGSPSGTKGLDLLLTDLGGRFLAEPVTEKGAALVEKLPEATEADMGKKRELAEKAAATITTRIDTTSLKKKLAKGFEHPVWEALGLPCVNCGACTFLCPTCHCFDVTDEELKGKGSRRRVWDSCQFCIYSQHASGHNPRVAPRSRYRNRVMDKFCYTVEQTGEISCVGCGRCIIECPAGIDIRETVETLMKALPE